MYHHLDPATVLRHRAAEIDRMLLAHHRRQRNERTSAPRSATARALRWL